MTGRPQTLAEIAVRAGDLTHFGWELQDWLHTVRSIHSRALLQRSIEPEPALLAGRFAEGRVADAWLAAYAEHAARTAGLALPAWARPGSRVLPEPWFSVDSPRERMLALRDTPPAFRSRNLFTPLVDLPLRLRAGRPPTTAEDKRRVNAERQRRFRARRALELELLRHAGKILTA